MINSIKCVFCIKKEHVYRYVLITVKSTVCFSATIAISVRCAYLKPNWLCAVLRYLASRDSTLERAVAIAIGLYLLTSAGSFDLNFSSGMITPCIREFGSLPCLHTTGKEYWHHGQQSLGCKLIDFRLNPIIADSLIIFQSFHNLPQLMFINNIIMGRDSPQCIHDLFSVVSGANRICNCTEMIIP